MEVDKISEINDSFNSPPLRFSFHLNIIYDVCKDFDCFSTNYCKNKFILYLGRDIVTKSIKCTFYHKHELNSDI